MDSQKGSIRLLALADRAFEVVLGALELGTL